MRGRPDAGKGLLVSNYVYYVLNAKDPVACAVKLFASGYVHGYENPCLRAVNNRVELNDVDLLFADLIENVDEKAVSVHGNDNELYVVA